MGDILPKININNASNSEGLEMFLNATGVGIWDWEIQTGNLTFNKIWAEILGHTLEELQPIQFNTWSSNLHPDDLIKA